MLIWKWFYRDWMKKHYWEVLSWKIRASPCIKKTFITQLQTCDRELPCRSIYKVWHVLCLSVVLIVLWSAMAIMSRSSNMATAKPRDAQINSSRISCLAINLFTSMDKRVTGHPGKDLLYQILHQTRSPRTRVYMLS